MINFPPSLSRSMYLHFFFTLGKVTLVIRGETIQVLFFALLTRGRFSTCVMPEDLLAVPLHVHPHHMYSYMFRSLFCRVLFQYKNVEPQQQHRTQTMALFLEPLWNVPLNMVMFAVYHSNRLLLMASRQNKMLFVTLLLNLLLFAVYHPNR